MNANEFRLENLVILGNEVGKIIQIGENNRIVLWLPSGKYSEPIVLKNSKGIPLTEELLLKLGFIDKTGGYRGTGAEVVFELRVPGAIISLAKGAKVPWDYWVFPYYATEIRFLHQLQNLFFALTGEELTVSL